MTQAEIIDLVSSSPNPPEPKGISTISPAAGLSLKISPKKPLKPVEKYDGWLDISDFSDTGIFSSKKEVVSISPSPRVLADKKEDYEEEKYIDDGIWFVDDDYYNSPKLVPGTAVAGSMPILSKLKNCNRDMDADFWDLSDDSVHTNSPHGSFDLCLEPAKKKQRLTPELEPRTAAKIAVSKEKGIARAGSDIARLSKSSSAGIGREKSVGSRVSKSTVTEDDLIMSPSLLDEFSLAREKREKSRQETDAEIEDDVFNYAEPSFRQIKSRTATSRPNATNASTSATMCLRGRKCEDISGSASDSDLPDINNIHSKSSLSMMPTSTRKAASKRRATGNSEKTAEQKAKERALKAQEQFDAKEAEKERKRLEREQKVQKKQAAADLARVNMLRTDKKISTPEMIVDLPLGIDERLATQVRQFLDPLGVECTEWSSPIPNVIKWRRKVDAQFNEELGHWEPTEKHIETEKPIMCVMLAQELVDLASEDKGHDLDAHVSRMKARFDNSTIMYLIEGLTSWIRKNRNVKNKQFADAVRSQTPREEAVPISSGRRSKKKQEKYVDEDMVEDALLRLQVIHGTLMHHTSCTLETAEWVMNFTQHISTIPYR